VIVKRSDARRALKCAYRAPTNGSRVSAPDQLSTGGVAGLAALRPSPRLFQKLRSGEKNIRRGLVFLGRGRLVTHIFHGH